MRFFVCFAAIVYLKAETGVYVLESGDWLWQGFLGLLLVLAVFSDLRDAFGSRCQHQLPEKKEHI